MSVLGNDNPRGDLMGSFEIQDNTNLRTTNRNCSRFHFENLIYYSQKSSQHQGICFYVKGYSVTWWSRNKKRAAIWVMKTSKQLDDTTFWWCQLSLIYVTSYT